MVPFCRPDIRPENVKAVSDVITSGWLTTGPNCTLLESRLEERIGCPHVELTSSLTVGVAPFLSALFEHWTWSRKPVAVFPVWTFTSVPMEFLHAGFDVKFVDVDHQTLMMPLATYDADIIVPTHLFGNQLDLHALRALNPRATIIDDAAHLSPDKRDLSPVVASLYSFYATKPLSTGEGGAVAITDSVLAQRFRQARLHGISKDAFGRYRDPSKSAQLYDVVRPGWKANMLDSCAAFGLSMLPRLDEMRLRRRDVIDAYDIALAPLGIEVIEHDDNSSCHLAAIRLPKGVDRTMVMQGLASRGIVTSVHFTPLHRMTFWAEVAAGVYPVADDNADRMLSLPLSSAMTEGDLNEVIRGVWDVFPSGGYARVKRASGARSR